MSAVPSAVDAAASPALAQPAAAAPAGAPTPAAGASADPAAAAAASAVPPPPSKGLLLRVKRKRNEAPLDTLLVTSNRAEKRAAVDELRRAFHKSAALSHAEQGAAAAAAAAPAAAVSADGAAAASAGAAPSPAAPSPSPSGASSGGGLFRAPAAAPATSPTHRIFKLLTTLSTPKEQHASNDKIQQRIAQLRHNRQLAHPSAQVSTADVHQKHLLAQQLSTQEKRELLLQHNREKMAALGQAPPQPALLHHSDDLLVKIVDIKLPTHEAAAAAGAGSSASRTTFQPPPMSAREAAAASRAHRKEQRRREAEVELSGSSHRSASSSTLLAGGGKVGSTSVVDPREAAQQFTRAMSSIKQMPQIGRAQMDAYKGLLEDYLSTLPPVPQMQESKEQPPQVQRDRVYLPGQKEREEAEAKAAAAAAADAEPRPQSPFQNQIAPKIPLRRRKKQGEAAAATPSAAAAAAAAPAAGSPAVPLSQPLPFVHTPDQALPQHILASKATFTAGGIPYDPRLLVPTTGTSLHQAGRELAGARGGGDPVGMQEADSEAVAPDADDSEYVYDVYHLPDPDTPMELPDHGRTPANHIHGSDTAVPLSMVTTGIDTGDNYKARYDGASSAYVVLRDGLLEWVGGSNDELVHEDSLAAQDEGAGDEDDEDDNEMSDYPDEEDSSAEEEHEETQRWMPDDDEDNQPYRAAAGGPDFPLTTYRPHHTHSLQHFRHAAQRPHGFYPEGPDADEDDDDNIVREVRRSMRAGHPDLSSSDDDEEGCAPYRVQEDEEYTDVIHAEEDMDDEREEQMRVREEDEEIE